MKSLLFEGPLKLLHSSKKPFKTLLKCDFNPHPDFERSDHFGDVLCSPESFNFPLIFKGLINKLEVCGLLVHFACASENTFSQFDRLAIEDRFVPVTHNICRQRAGVMVNRSFEFARISFLLLDSFAKGSEELLQFEQSASLKVVGKRKSL